jgi:hypothetical protein
MLSDAEYQEVGVEVIGRESGCRPRGVMAVDVEIMGLPYTVGVVLDFESMSPSAILSATIAGCEPGFANPPRTDYRISIFLALAFQSIITRVNDGQSIVCPCSISTYPSRRGSLF